MNCGTCAHWVRRDQYEAGHSLGLGKCKAAIHLYEATDWLELPGNDYVNAIRPEYADTLAFTQDASDYRADLLTKPEFGCVMYKENP